MTTFSHSWHYFAEFCLEWERFKQSRKESQNTFFMHRNLFFQKSCRLWDNFEKCGGAKEAADDHMEARCMLDNSTYTRASTLQRPCIHTHIHALTYARAHAHTHTHTQIYNTYCFSTTTVSWTLLNITLYVPCLSSHLIRFFTTKKLKNT